MKSEKLKSSLDFIVTTGGGHLSYDGYLKVLKRYCVECGIKPISTHKLRHSTSELYMHFGATRDDLRILFNHSSNKVTDRYVHDKGERLSAITEKINILSFS